MSDSAAPFSSISVGDLVSDRGLGIELKVVAGERGLENPISHPRVQKGGLALAGHYHGVAPSRVQVLGETELSYLAGLPAKTRRRSIGGFLRLHLSCVVLTRGAEPPEELVREAVDTATPIIVSPLRSSATINAVHALLDDRLAPRARSHGVLVDVFGVGLLLMGASGIGKSECALELVMRGHRLVADDAVDCDFRPPGMVFGQPPDLLRYHIEVRGLGVLNIKDLFGVTSIRQRKRIDVVVRLVEWSSDTEYDRMGLDEHWYSILGVPIRELIIPVRPGRNMGSILEMAARNELLRAGGHDGAKDFFHRLEGALLARGRPLEPESIAAPPIPGRLGARR